ncbi:MAG TPA: iron-containing alcohol dehydrogenase, partial [Thermoplasmata archaeon]|nr:iron-containing alcohol dehydrogenase [Thermoplasmata archaeon]
MSPNPDQAMPLVSREDGDTRIILGPGAIALLPGLLAEIGRHRAFLVAGRSVSEGKVGARVRSALGDALVGSFSDARPHVPVETSEETATAADAARADILLGLGGGSPIGTAKAAVSILLSKASNSRVPKCVVAAIPTTYAGSEVTPVFGTTDLAQGRKSVVRNFAVRPRLALYDSELAIETPAELTASTGVNALAHCVEALYSTRDGDADHPMALRAAGRIITHLPKAVAEPANVYERYKMFEGSMEAGLVLAHVGMGVHHGLCHVLGGRYNAPHGDLNAIILPHAMRFNIPVATVAYRELASILHVAA